MEITLNDRIKVIDTVTILALLEKELSDKMNGIAVAVNNTVIPRAGWDTYEIKNNDNILIIKATQGG